MVLMGFIIAALALVLFAVLSVLMYVLMRRVHRARDHAGQPKLFETETANATLLVAMTVSTLLVTCVAAFTAADTLEPAFLAFSVLSLAASFAGFAVCLIGCIHLRRQCWDVLHRRTGNIVLPRSSLKHRSL